MLITKDQLIGDIVSEDYRAASIFESFDIEFCCEGDQSLENVCLQKKIKPKKILKNLTNLMEENIHSYNFFQAWDVDLLADYLEKKHNKLLNENIPEISNLLEKIIKKHKSNARNINDISVLWKSSAEIFINHMHFEHREIFPDIRDIKIKFNEVKSSNIVKNNTKIIINDLKEEHHIVGKNLKQIAKLTNHFTAEIDDCNTMKLFFTAMETFYAEVLLHIHIENNILFPKYIKLIN